jgi:hypothetical protein
MAASGTGPCTPEIIERLSTDTKFAAWKTATDTSLNAISPAAGNSRPPTPGEEQTLSALEADIRSTGKCITERKEALATTTNSISKAQEDKLELDKKIKDAGKDVEVARDRIGYIKHPEQHSTFHGSWFPLNRPINKNSIPILNIFTAIFIFIGVYTLFPLIGVNVTVTYDFGLQGFIDSFKAQFTSFTFVLILVLAVFMYREIPKLSTPPLGV